MHPFNGSANEFGSARQMQLFFDVRPMRLNRADTQMQFLGDLPGSPALAQQPEHFQFAVAEILDF